MRRLRCEFWLWGGSDAVAVAAPVHIVQGHSSSNSHASSNSAAAAAAPPGFHNRGKAAAAGATPPGFHLSGGGGVSPFIPSPQPMPTDMPMDMHVHHSPAPPPAAAYVCPPRRLSASPLTPSPSVCITPHPLAVVSRVPPLDFGRTDTRCGARAVGVVPLRRQPRPQAPPGFSTQPSAPPPQPTSAPAPTQPQQQYARMVDTAARPSGVWGRGACVCVYVCVCACVCVCVCVCVCMCPLSRSQHEHPSGARVVRSELPWGIETLVEGS